MMAWFLIALFVFVCGAALAIDIGRIYMAHTFLTEVANSAATAGATAADPTNPLQLNKDAAKERASVIVGRQRSEGVTTNPATNLTSKITPSDSQIEVTVEGEVQNLIALRFVGQSDSVTVSSTATAYTCFAGDDRAGSQGAVFQRQHSCTRPDGVVKP